MPIENQSVRDYLLKRKAEREALEGQVKEESSGPNIAAALGAIGAGFQGKDSLAAGQGILERQDKNRKAKLTDFDAGTDRFLGENTAINSAEKMDREKAMLAAEDDVNSEESRMANDILKGYGYKGAPVSAAKFKTFSPYYQKKFEIEQARLAKEGKKVNGFTKGQEAVDKDYAKHFNTFTQTGKNNATNTIAKLEALAKEMEDDQGLGEAGGGRIAAVLPDVLRSRDAIRRRDDTRNAANTTLKELFGGQLSDAEREAAAKEYYNDALDNKTNAEILRRKIKDLQDNLTTQSQKADYFGQSGTVSGFAPQAPSDRDQQKTPQQLAQEELARRKANKTAGM